MEVVEGRGRKEGRGGRREMGGRGAESMRTDTGLVGKGGGGGGVLDFSFFAVKWEGRRKSTTHLMDRNGLITNNGKWAKQKK